MALLASLPGKVDFAGRSYGQVILRASVDSGVPVILLDVDVLTELTGQYDPTAPGSVVPIGNNGAIGVPVQSIVLKTEIEDIGTLRQDDLIAWSIQRTLTDGTAWSLTLPADKPDNTIRGYETADYIPPTNPAAGKLLHELDWLAPPPALKNVDFVPAYLLDDNNEVDIRLLTDGISSDSNRSIDPTGHIMTINGLGPEGRYDRAIVCYLLPAGHGLTHGEIIEDLALLAGVPASKIAIGAQDGEPLIKPIEIINEIWWDVAIEIADGANLIPYFDEFGVLRLRGYPPYEGASTQFNFTRANVSAGAKLEVQLNADVPTCVRVTATQLVPPEDPCDVVTKVTLTETLQPFSIPVATHRQGPSGNITATGAIPSPTVLQVVRRETVIQEIWGSCQKVQEVITEEWFNPECHRYKLDATGAPAAYNDSGAGGNGPWFFEEATKDDQTTGYLWQTYRFVEVSRIRTVLDVTFDESDCGNDYPIGRHRTQVTYTAAWARPEFPAKDGPPATDWDSEPFNAVLAYADRVPAGTNPSQSVASIASATYLDGPGGNYGGLYSSTPANPPEYVKLNPPAPTVFGPMMLGDGQWFGVEWVEYIADPVCETYIVAQNTNRISYGVFEQPGGQYLMSDGKVTDVRGLINIVTADRVLNLVLSESTYASKQTSIGPGLDTTEVVYQTFDGYLPALPSCQNQEQESIQEFQYDLCALLDSHERQLLTVSNEFIESEDALEAYGIRILREATAVTINVPTSANFVLREGMKIHVEVPEARISRDAWIHSVDWQRNGQGAPVVALIIAKIYLF